MVVSIRCRTMVTAAIRKVLRTCKPASSRHYPGLQKNRLFDVSSRGQSKRNVRFARSPACAPTLRLPLPAPVWVFASSASVMKVYTPPLGVATRQGDRMKFTTCAALFFLFALSEQCQAQRADSQASASQHAPANTATPTIVNLLRESHDVARQLSTEDRLHLLAMQTRMVSALNSDLGKEWASELLLLDTQANRKNPYYSLLAIGILIKLDPDHPLEPLDRLNWEETGLPLSPYRPNMLVVHRAFDVLAERDGLNALPLLEQESARLAFQGHYPYSALGYAAMQSVSKDWGNDNQQAIRVLQSVFEPAYENYSRNRRDYFDDIEFGDMLGVLSGGLPADSVRPALTLLVENLLGTNTQKVRFQVRIYTNDGKIVRSDNAIDAALLHFGNLICRVNPDLARQLATTRPDLAALESTKDGLRRSEVFGSSPSSAPAPHDDTAVQLDAIRLSGVNADSAVAKAGEVQDSALRDATKLEVARGVSRKDPAKAAQLIEEVQESSPTPDKETQLNLISAQADLAARQGKSDELRQLIQQAFALAGQIISDQQNTDALRDKPPLGHLSQIAMQTNPDLLLAFVGSLPPSYMKADMLLGAAASLQLPPFMR
jgi:hypothetical protein